MASNISEMAELTQDQLESLAGYYLQDIPARLAARETGFSEESVKAFFECLEKGRLTARLH